MHHEKAKNCSCKYYELSVYNQGTLGVNTLGKPLAYIQILGCVFVFGCMRYGEDKDPLRLFLINHFSYAT